MTRESLKEYYMQISTYDDEVNSRWRPEIICEQVDFLFDYFEQQLKEKDAEINRLKEELRKNHHRGCPCEICKPNIKEKIV